MSAPPAAAVLGFRPHTYWTAAVAIAGPASGPRVLERRKILFAAGDERGVYHQAETLTAAQAEALLARVWAATVGHATRGIGQMVADLKGDGLALGAAVVPEGRTKPPDSVAEIVRSHSLMHLAEGEFYRNVVAQACTDLGLAVTRLKERALPGLVGEALGEDQGALDGRLKAMGATLGPPWGEDHKLATLAAWTQL